jgi:hypothetical protein
LHHGLLRYALIYLYRSERSQGIFAGVVENCLLTITRNWHTVLGRQCDYFGSLIKQHRYQQHQFYKISYSGCCSGIQYGNPYGIWDKLVMPLIILDIIFVCKEAVTDFDYVLCVTPDRFCQRWVPRRRFSHERLWSPDRIHIITINFRFGPVMRREARRCLNSKNGQSLWPIVS